MGGSDLALRPVRELLENTTDHSLVVSISLMVTLLCACIVIGHLLEENRWMNESITAMILGLFTGTIVLLTTKGTKSHVLEFNEELFFMYLLPPIIFNAGFQVKKKQFFRNFVAIVLFGVIGVFISFAIISVGGWLIFPLFNLESSLSIRDYMALGVIFSATDTVCTLQILHQDETPLLYSLVFGEGVVNDATSVVLFRTVENYSFDNINTLTVLQMLSNFVYLFLTSTLLGLAVGLLSAYIIKKLYFGRHSTDREIAVMILMAYLSYVMAELFYLSSILTVFICGIVMSHYTWHNVTESSKTTTRHTFATLSFIAETFIFLYVGMDALDKDKWEMTNVSMATSIGLSSILVGVVLIGRAAFVFPLSALSNWTRRTRWHKDWHPTAGHYLVGGSNAWGSFYCPSLQQDIIFVTWILQFNVSSEAINPMHATLITSTIIVVLFTTVVFGLLTKPLIQWLIPDNVESDSDNSGPPTPKEGRFNQGLETPLLDQVEIPVAQQIVENRGIFQRFCHSRSSTIHSFWRTFDDRYMRPMFGGRGFTPFVPEKIPE